MKLENMLAYVAENNDFYQKIIQEHNITSPTDITQFPILSRQTLQENINNILSKDYKNQHMTNQLYRLSSSGTSGISTETYWDPMQYDRSMLCLWRRRRKYYNISANEKYIDFMLKSFNTIKTDTLYYAIRGNNISVNRLGLNNKTVMAELFELINKTKPVWLQIAPSVMEMILNFYYEEHSSLPESIRYIEFLSEVLTDSIRKQTMEVFPNASLSNMYGSEEMNSIAFECPCGKMHILSDNVFAECYNGSFLSPTGEGTIILTNLHNMATPLIRYDQGDEVVIEPKQKCACGYSDKIISHLIGRKSSSAIINGLRLSTCDVSDIMIVISNKFGNPIKKYKFIYNDKNKTLLCYTLFNKHFAEWKEQIWTLIENLFIRKYGEVKMCFFMDDIDEKSYKHDLFTVK